MKKYEYKTITTDAKGLFGGKVDIAGFDEQLNELGEQGWDLIASIASNESYGSTRYVLSTFKREKA